MQPVAVHQRAKALAAQTKPFRAGVRHRASAELQLTANAGRCEWLSWARIRAVALLSESMAAQMEPAGRSAAPYDHKSFRQKQAAGGWALLGAVNDSEGALLKKKYSYSKPIALQRLFAGA